MIMPPTLARGQNPVPNRVLSVGHFNRAEVGHFCLAPRADGEESPGKEKKAEMNLGSAGLTACATLTESRIIQ